MSYGKKHTIAIRLYKSLKLHFTQKDYNFLERKIKIKAKYDDAQVNAVKYLAEKYTPQELIGYYTSAFLNDPRESIFNMQKEHIESNYKKWKAHIDALDFTIKKDLSNIDFLCKGKWKEIFKKNTGDVPKIVLYEKSGEISKETLIVVLKSLGFFDRIVLPYLDDHLWNQTFLSYNKYDILMNFDEKTYQKDVRNYIILSNNII